jgi:hypothetical protein
MKELDVTCQRSELRVNQELAVFVETYSTPSGEWRRPNVVVSKTVDLSANGLQIVMDKPMATGSILQLCVEFIGEPTHYHLTGEVKWVATVGRKHDYLVGFLLMESDGTDIELWKLRIAQMLADPTTIVS